MKLAIISHTEHYLRDGQVVGWGPTVREINELKEVFEEIWHVAALKPGPPPASALPYESDKIHFVAIPPFGGEMFQDKLKVLWLMPGILRTVRRVLDKADCFHFRVPTGIGNFLIPYLSLCCRKPGWFKYAGNWVQKNAPLGYRWQRWWLSKMQHRPVTINGRWPKQAEHLLSFENPCLSDKELERAAGAKSFASDLTLCFVGSLTPNKGARALLEALSHLENGLFGKVLLAGDGQERESLEKLAEKSKISVQLLGFQSRSELDKLYAQAHFIALPSENEGFPKVIAEAAAHGCIPIVTDVSCIGQYVRDGENGFLLADNSPATIQAKLEQLSTQRHKFPDLSANARAIARDFTYSRYVSRIKAICQKLNLQG